MKTFDIQHWDGGRVVFAGTIRADNAQSAVRCFYKATTVHRNENGSYTARDCRRYPARNVVAMATERKG